MSFQILAQGRLSIKRAAVVALGGYIGGILGATQASVGAILYPTVAGSSPNEYVDISGDYRGKNIIIGYIYTMTVDLPKFYYNQGDPQAGKSDYTSDLIMYISSFMSTSFKTIELEEFDLASL